MKAFIHKHHFRKTLFLSLFAVLLFACKTHPEFNGDILESVKADSSATISFKKDKDSPVAFERTYLIGRDYTFQDLPGNDDENVDNLNPGFDLVGWKLDESDDDLQNIFTFDDSGCITAFHMGPRSITLYGGAYIAATDTPYKIVYKTQNLTMDGYNDYDQVMLEGTTSSPVAPSYTDAKNNLINIPGFTVRLDLLKEVEILADGSAVVEVLYDRTLYTLKMHINDGSGDSEATTDQNFYYQVPAQLTPNKFTRPGCSFVGWATTRERAAAKTVDYTDGANYTIGSGSADLYAIWTLPHISVTISLPGSDQVGITYKLNTTNTNKVTLSAVIPSGHTDEEYTYKWFKTNEGPSSVLNNLASWELDTSEWTAGYYQITLIAELKTATGTPAGGGTIQIKVED